ncbi:MAG TPA: hypothetical protein VF026_12495 [Ktedonobacteraceae bacterium]
MLCAFAAVSQQQLLQRDRQVADAHAGGVIDGVGNGGNGADDPDFTYALRDHGIDVSSRMASSQTIFMMKQSKRFLTRAGERDTLR